MDPHLTRRRFLALLPLVLLPRRARASGLCGIAGPRHPDPRPGITAARVLAASRLTDKSAAPVFDMVRKIPEIVDGIRCSCGCADVKEFYSLLSCYEGDGMAQHCVVCQGQARLAYKLHKQGRSLAAIRKAIDAEFGD